MSRRRRMDLRSGRVVVVDDVFAHHSEGPRLGFLCRDCDVDCLRRIRQGLIRLDPSSDFHRRRGTRRKGRPANQNLGIHLFQTRDPRPGDPICKE